MVVLLAMAYWKQEYGHFTLYEEHRVVGRVVEDRKTDRCAVGWRAYALGEPVQSPHAWTGPLRHIEDVGYFRHLRDAMKHVNVLHALNP